MDWIRADANLPHHPKTRRLARLLDDPNAMVYLVRLWMWAAQFAISGDLSAKDYSEIAVGCEYPGDPDHLVTALVTAHWLDRDGTRLKIHDWEEHQGKLIERRARETERKRSWRRSQRSSDGPSPAMPAPQDGSPREFATVKRELEVTLEVLKEEQSLSADRFRALWGHLHGAEVLAQLEEIEVEVQRLCDGRTRSKRRPAARAEKPRKVAAARRAS